MISTSSTLIVLSTLFTGNIIVTETDADNPALVMLERDDNIDNSVTFTFPICATKTCTGIDYSTKELPYYIPTYFCPAESEITSQINLPAGCLLPDARPKTCKHEVRPVLQIPSSKTRGYGRRMSLYALGYLICVVIERKKNYFKALQDDHDADVSKTPQYDFIEQFEAVYEVHYDHESNRPVYYLYKIHSPSLLDNEVLREQSDPNPNPELINSDLGGEGFGDRFKALADLCKSTDQNSHDQAPDLPALVQVVPEKHMAFPLWRKPLRHYINVQPMRKHLTELWERIDDYIARRAVPSYGEITIKVGFLYEVNDPIMPSTWWKLIKDQHDRKGILIVVHDVASSSSPATPTPIAQHRFCETSVCDSYGWTEMIKEEEAHYAYCCDPNTLSELHHHQTDHHLEPLQLQDPSKPGDANKMADNWYTIAKKHCNNNGINLSGLLCCFGNC